MNLEKCMKEEYLKPKLLWNIQNHLPVFIIKKYVQMILKFLNMKSHALHPRGGDISHCFNCPQKFVYGLVFTKPVTSNFALRMFISA